MNLYFCGCCDFRKAVFVFNLIALAVALVTAFVLPVMLNQQEFVDQVEENYQEQFDDATGQNLDPRAVGRLVEVKMIANILVSALGVFGAWKFHKWALITTATAYGVFTVLDLLAGIPGLVIAWYWALAMYPHIMMIKLMDAGIMTEENYPNISSCCGSNSQAASPNNVATKVPNGSYV